MSYRKLLFWDKLLPKIIKTRFFVYLDSKGVSFEGEGEDLNLARKMHVI